MPDDSRVVVVVEDNPDDFEATERSLRRTGFASRIVHCTDGDEALEYLRAENVHAESGAASRPGLVLLDLNLPGTDGREVLAKMKASPRLRHIPVIVLTTSTDARDVADCYAAGANSYMNKRVDFEEFMESIQRMSEFWMEIAVLPRCFSGSSRVAGHRDPVADSATGSPSGAPRRGGTDGER